jgi:hypothetical protein
LSGHTKPAAGFCGKGYLQASPNVRYARIPGPDFGGEALKHKSTHLIGERQFALQHFSVKAAQFQDERDRWAR